MAENEIAPSLNIKHEAQDELIRYAWWQLAEQRGRYEIKKMKATHDEATDKINGICDVGVGMRVRGNRPACITWGE